MRPEAPPKGPPAWRCDECEHDNPAGTLECLACELPHPQHFAEGDAQCNEFGVYVRGVETVNVPIRATSKHGVKVRLVQDRDDGLWRYGYDVRGPYQTTGGFSGPPSRDGRPYPTREAALTEALLFVVEELEKGRPGPDSGRRRAMAIEDCRRMMATLQDAVECENGRDRKKSAASKRKPNAGDQAAGELTVPIERIVVAHNARQDFQAEGAEDLVPSVRVHGLLQPLLVAPADADGNHTLIAGERRLQAARQTGLARVPVRVFAGDAAAQRGAALDENVRRKDLNPIERAQAFQDLIDARPGATQRQIAAEYGLSQPVLANTLAVLKLPAAWQRRLIAREITEAHARHLAAWRDRPKLLEAIDKALTTARKGHTGGVPEKEFQRLVIDAVHQQTRSLGAWPSPPEFKVTPELKAQLDVVEVPNKWDRGKTQRACNTTLWDEKQKEAKKRKAARAAKKTTAVTGKAAKAKAEPKVTPDPYALRGLWVACCMRAIADRLEPGPQAARVTLFLLTTEFGGEMTYRLVRQLTGSKGVYLDDGVLWGKLEALKQSEFEQVFLDAVRHELREATAFGGRDYEWLAGLARWMGIDPAQGWTPSAEWFGLLSDDQLRELARQVLDVDDLPPDKAKRSQWIEALSSSTWPAGAGVPDVFQIKPPKARKKRKR